jgi:allantoate deiminase
MAIQIERIQNDIEIINQFNATPDRGVTRLTFSEEYRAAVSHVVGELNNLGAKIFHCRGGNLKARFPGKDDHGPAVMMGSHLDTVAHGGQFDGVVGVVTALEAARIIVEDKIAHRLPIDIVVFAEEEGSRFNRGLLGSSVWTGKLDAAHLDHIKDAVNISYTEAMQQAGFEINDNTQTSGQCLRFISNRVLCWRKKGIVSDWLRPSPASNISKSLLPAELTMPAPPRWKIARMRCRLLPG